MAPKSEGVWREEWQPCDRCGFYWPISMLQKQLGSIRCPYDIDDLSNFYRPKIIAEVLKQPEGLSDKPEVFRSGEEIEF